MYQSNFVLAKSSRLRLGGARKCSPPHVATDRNVEMTIRSVVNIASANLNRTLRDSAIFLLNYALLRLRRFENITHGFKESVISFDRKNSRLSMPVLLFRPFIGCSIICRSMAHLTAYLSLLLLPSLVKGLDFHTPVEHSLDGTHFTVAGSLQGSLFDLVSHL